MTTTKTKSRDTWRSRRDAPNKERTAQIVGVLERIRGEHEQLREDNRASETRKDEELAIAAAHAMRSEHLSAETVADALGITRQAVYAMLKRHAKKLKELKLNGA